MKGSGERSAGNPPAAFEVAGAGDGLDSDGRVARQPSTLQRKKRRNKRKKKRKGG
jgi:hypothetical protein